MVSIDVRFLLIFIFTANVAYANSFSALYLSPFKTKQAIENIRFISHDGFYTYFQQNSGSLLLSKGFSTKTVFKDVEHTQYNVLGSQSKRKLIVTKDKTYYAHLNLKKTFEIFLLDYGEIDAEIIGEGILPKLHLKDTWISFFNPQTNTIHVNEIAGDKKKYSILLKAPNNSYHQPSVEMLKDNYLVYTDLTLDNKAQVIAYYPQTKQQDLVYQSANAGLENSLCFLNQLLIIGEFSKSDINLGSTIMSIDTVQSPSLKRIETLYNTKSQDQGSMICLDQSIYFKKERVNKDEDEDISMIIPRQDLYSLTLPEKTLTAHTKTKNLGPVLLMDNRLIAVNNGDFYELTKTPPPKNKQLEALEDKRLEEKLSDE